MGTMLVLAILLPFGGAACVLVMSAGRRGGIPVLSFVLAAAEALLVGWLALGLYVSPARAAVMCSGWMPGFPVHLAFRVDAAGGALAWIACLVTCACLVPRPWEGPRRSGFQAAALAMTGSTVGAFYAADPLLFAVFFLVGDVLAYLLVRGEGGGDREHAALRVFAQSAAGGMALLLAVLAAAQYGGWIMGASPGETTAHVASGESAWVAWLGLAGAGVAFLVRMGMAPAHVAFQRAMDRLSSSEGAVLMGVWVPVGAYGLVRIWPLLGDGALAGARTALMSLGCAGALVAGLGALVGRGPDCRGRRWSGAMAGFLLAGVSAGDAASCLGSIVLATCVPAAAAALCLWSTPSADCGEGAVGAEPRPRVLHAVYRGLGTLAAGIPGSGIFVAMFLVLTGLWRVDPYVGGTLAASAFLLAVAHAVPAADDTAAASAAGGA